MVYLEAYPPVFYHSLLDSALSTMKVGMLNIIVVGEFPTVESEFVPHGFGINSSVDFYLEMLLRCSFSQRLKNV